MEWDIVIFQTKKIYKTKRSNTMLESRGTSIIIQTNNNLHNNIICLEGIRDYTSSEPYEIIVIDNNSTDRTREWLKQQWDIKLILNDENMGFSKGYNSGIEHADKENDILLLSSDVKVTPRWLDNLKVCLYSDNSIGAVSSITNQCTNYQGITVQYEDIDEMISFAFRNNVSKPEKWEETPTLQGFCMLIKREITKKIGNLDEGFTLESYGCDDLCMRIINEGYKLMLCNDSFVYNIESEAFEKDYKSSLKARIVNKQRFKEKWGAISAGKEIKGQLLNSEFIEKYQKDLNDIPLSHDEILVEVKYAMRRIEYDIDKYRSLGLIKYYYDDKKVSLEEIGNIIETDIINKDDVENIISSYLE
jgi:GT2 family glycosyltransferase